MKILNEGTLFNVRRACLAAAISTLALDPVGALAKPAPTTLSSAAARDLFGVWWIDTSITKLAPSDGSTLPFTAAGRARYVKIQSDRKAGRAIDETHKFCLPKGVTRLATTLYPFEIVPSAGQITVFYEENGVFRHFYLGGKHPDKDADNPNFLGDSIANWEGETLVVDTTNLNDKTFLDATGLPHGEKLHVVERYRKLDIGHLENTVTVEDPDFFTKPWSFRVVYSRRPDIRLEEYLCGEKHRDVSRIGLN